MTEIKIRQSVRLIKLLHLYRQRKMIFIVSLCNVIVLLFLSYFINNQAIFTGEDLNKYAWMEWIKNKCVSSKDVEGEKDALFVNCW